MRAAVPEELDNFDLAESVLPILPLRNSVLFPVSVVPVNVGRSRSVRLIETACGGERPVIAVVAQKRAETEDPGFDEARLRDALAQLARQGRGLGDRLVHLPIARDQWGGTLVCCHSGFLAGSRMNAKRSAGS